MARLSTPRARRMLASLTLAGIAAFSPPAIAQSVEAQIAEQLRAQGFTELTTSRTFLGRVRIQAVGNGVFREIVVNPSTGVILRDYWVDEDGNRRGALVGGVPIDPEDGDGEEDIDDEDESDEEEQDEGDEDDEEEEEEEDEEGGDDEEEGDEEEGGDDEEEGDEEDDGEDGEED